jgi:hypothetical protein
MHVIHHTGSSRYVAPNAVIVAIVWTVVSLIVVLVAGG